MFAPPIKPDGQLDHDGPHEVIEAVALIDSGCTDNLISRRLVDSRSIPIRPMGQPKYPKLADGTRSSTPINEETAALRVRIGDHEEPLAFNVAPLPDYDIFLGAPWLSLHNPTINWTEGRITFDSEFCTEQCVPDKRMTQLPTSVQPQILKSCVAKLHFPSKSPDGKPLPRLKKMKPPKEVAQEIMALCATFLTSSDSPDSGQPDSSPPSPSTTATTTMPPSSTCCPDPVPPSESPPVKTPTYTVSPGTDMGDTCIGPSGEQSSFNVLFDDEDDMTPTQYLLHLAEVVDEAETIFDALSGDLDPLFYSYVDPAYPPEPPDKDVLKTQVPAEFHDFLDVFSKTLSTKLPDHKPWDIKIDLLPDKPLPPHVKPYRKTRHELEVEREWVRKHLELGLIRKSESPVCASLMFVPKKDDDIGLRPVIDYRPINRITKKWPFPVPNIDDQLNKLSRKKYITRIDFRSAYYLIRVREGDEWKTSFVTSEGQFEFLVMPFGLTNAPAVFNSFIREAYADMEDTIVAFFDDLAVASDTLEENIRDVRRVLQRARELDLFVKAEKCEFFVQETQFLGHIVSHGKIKVLPSKIEAILKWPAPTNVRLLRGFLGLCNFYRRFIAFFAEIALVLHKRTRKNQPWKWDDECQAAFDRLKKALVTAPVLKTFDWAIQCLVEADASKLAIGAILSQMDDDGFPHPVEFFSRKLNDAEVNYDTYDKEMLAIVAAFKHWRPYLLHSLHQVVIYSDHHNLEYFMTPRKLNPRQNRWYIHLMEFDFIIKWRPGSQMGKADALSRQFDPAREDKEEELKQLIKPEWVDQNSIPDSVPPSHVHALFHFSTEDLEDLQPLIDIFSLEDTPNEHGNFVRHNLSLDRIRKAQHDDPDLQEIFDYLAAGNHVSTTPHPDSKDDVKFFSISEEGVLLFGNQIYVPRDPQLQLDLCRAAHNHLTLHSGWQKTHQYLAQFFHWYGMTKYVQKYVSGCLKCQRNRGPTHAKFGKLQPLRIPDRPHQCLAMDSILKLPPTPHNGYDGIYVFVDRLTKMIKLIPFKEDGLDSASFAMLIENHIINDWGPPEEIVCDNASIHQAGFTREFLRTRATKLLFSTAYHPQTDGQTERIIQIIKTYLRKCLEGLAQESWDQYLHSITRAYTTTYQASIKMTPYEALYHVPPLTPLKYRNYDIKSAAALSRAERIDAHFDRLKSNIRTAQERYSRYYDAHRKNPPNFKVGDFVFLNRRNIVTTRPSLSLDQRMIGPIRIMRATRSPNAFVLDLPAALSRLHPVFNVELLEPVREGHPGQYQEPAPVVKLPEEAEYPVEEILRTRVNPDMNPTQGAAWEFLVKWEGYSSDDNTWEPYENVKLLKDHLRRFVEKHYSDPEMLIPPWLNKYKPKTTSTANPDPRPRRRSPRTIDR